MSHMSTVVIEEFKNMDSIGTALRAMGFSLEQNANIRGYSGQSQDCQFGAKLPGRYDIGFNIVNGKIAVVYDGFTGAVEDSMGQDLGLLKQNYMVAEIIREAQEQGKEYEVNTNEQGVMFVDVRW